MRVLLLTSLFGMACLGGAAAQPSHETCVDAQVGTAQSYDCLNQKLQATARQTPKVSSETAAPYNANSPSNVTGQFNESATRNRLGSSFGRSVAPERPATSFAHCLRPALIAEMARQDTRSLDAAADDLEAGRATSRSLVERCLDRIADAHGEGSRTFITVYAVAGPQLG